MNQSNKQLMGAPLWIAHGIMAIAACNLTGWTLSLFGWLSLLPMLLTIAIFWAGLALLCDAGMPKIPSFRGWKLRRRRCLPLAFVILALLVLLGGIWHAPNNMDAMNYRLPRTLNWLTEQRWHWIEANNQALNTRACGFEWISAPIIALTRSDRLLFLPNWIAFLCMPSLIYAWFRNLGIAPRVAYSAMWLLPSGYCFALQAGSVGNDMLPVVCALAAFYFGSRWKLHRQRGDFAIALLACAMMTAVKPTTLPLLLPFAVVYFGMISQLWLHPLRTLALVILAATSSFLPTAVINHVHCGDWTGALAENPMLGEVQPLIGLAGNAINLPLQNLAPPIFPFARAWNAWFIQLFPESFLEAMARNFEPNGARFALPDFQAEEWVGIGAGICYVLILAFFAAITVQRSRWQIAPELKKFALVLGGFLIVALLAYSMRAGMSTVARHVSPYYLPLIACAMACVPLNRVVRSRWWNIAAVGVMGASCLLVILSPARPLWPAQSFFAKIGGEHPSPMIQRAAMGFRVYAERADGLGALRDHLPDDAKWIGFMSYHTGPELALWRPYLTRRVSHVLPNRSILPMVASGMRHVVLNVKGFENAIGITPEAWLAKHQGKILHRATLQILVKEEASEWWAVELPDQP